MYFEIYDLNFKQIPLPKDNLDYGLTGLGLYVSSIGQDVIEHTASRVPGNVITGVRDSDRDVRITAMLRTMNATDTKLKRDRVYAYFISLGSFYITETQQGNKLLKVRVVDSYEPDILNKTFAIVDIPLKVDGQPYWISRKKTMDLHTNNGIPSNGNWSFGMGIDVEPEELKYVYEDARNINIYNAGKELKTIQEKDNCKITIEFTAAIERFSLIQTNGGRFNYNYSNKEEWRIKAGDVLVINGHDIKLNGTPVLNRTNRYFIVLNNGKNIINYAGFGQAYKYKITFDFRFKYY